MTEHRLHTHLSKSYVAILSASAAGAARRFASAFSAVETLGCFESALSAVDRADEVTEASLRSAAGLAETARQHTLAKGAP